MKNVQMQVCCKDNAARDKESVDELGREQYD